METTTKNGGMETKTTETKVCKECKRELPITDFQATRGGSTMCSCRECVNKARTYTRNYDLQQKQTRAKLHDTMFDSLQPVDVLHFMGRAKRWLESRGYEIALRGSLTVKKEVKFE